MKEEINTIEQILDDENNDNIFLYNENGERFELEQLAVIPFNDKLYVILHPVTPLEDLGENDVLIFEIDEDEDELKIVTDMDLIEIIMEDFNDLLEENA
ncbi:MAG: DUF1292 domain-containing protein [Bacillales bacterium]|jgi:hypothetical protein|nr:DUF1292 domain-containing protein [Bacillales bacterium]